MKNLEEERYQRAKYRANEVRAFHFHLATYIMINLFLLYYTFVMVGSDRSDFRVDIAWWGVAFWTAWLCFRGLKAFDALPFLNKEWKERKIKEFMKKERESFNEIEKF